MSAQASAPHYRFNLIISNRDMTLQRQSNVFYHKLNLIRRFLPSYGGQGPIRAIVLGIVPKHFVLDYN